MRTDPNKTRFLLAALPDVPFDGWTDALMERTAGKLKLGAAATVKMFPYGSKDLLVYFFGWVTAETLGKMKKSGLGAMRVRDRIALGVKTRLEILGPYKRAAAAAPGFLSPRQIWQAADRIWWAAGDASTDHNHYTKRILLSGVLVSTTLYWLNDASESHRQTWAFLERRIDNVLKLGQKLSRFGKKKEG